MSINLKLLPSVYCVAKLSPADDIPVSVSESSEFYSFSKSSDEASLLCAQSLISNNIVADRDWRLFQYKGSIEDNIVGVVARIAQPLADSGISVIVTTTYDSGFFGVKVSDLEQAIEVMQRNSIIVDI